MGENEGEEEWSPRRGVRRRDEKMGKLERDDACKLRGLPRRERGMLARLGKRRFREGGCGDDCSRR